MIKGCQKKIVILKDTGSAIFDEAYFILKENRESRWVSHTDMITEANRIVNSNLLCTGKIPDRYFGRRKVPVSVSSLVWYAAGLLSGGFIFGLINLIF